MDDERKNETADQTEVASEVSSSESVKHKSLVPTKSNASSISDCPSIPSYEALDAGSTNSGLSQSNQESFSDATASDMTTDSVTPRIVSKAHTVGYSRSNERFSITPVDEIELKPIRSAGTISDDTERLKSRSQSPKSVQFQDGQTAGPSKSSKRPNSIFKRASKSPTPTTETTKRNVVKEKSLSPQRSLHSNNTLESRGSQASFPSSQTTTSPRSQDSFPSKEEVELPPLPHQRLLPAADEIQHDVDTPDADRSNDRLLPDGITNHGDNTRIRRRQSDGRIQERLQVNSIPNSPSTPTCRANRRSEKSCWVPISLVCGFLFLTIIFGAMWVGISEYIKDKGNSTEINSVSNETTESMINATILKVEVLHTSPDDKGSTKSLKGAGVNSASRNKISDETTNAKSLKGKGVNSATGNKDSNETTKSTTNAKSLKGEDVNSAPGNIDSDETSDATTNTKSPTGEGVNSAPNNNETLESTTPPANDTTETTTFEPSDTTPNTTFE